MVVGFGFASLASRIQKCCLLVCFRNQKFWLRNQVFAYGKQDFAYSFAQNSSYSLRPCCFLKRARARARREARLKSFSIYTHQHFITQVTTSNNSQRANNSSNQQTAPIATATTMRARARAKRARKARARTERARGCVRKEAGPTERPDRLGEKP